MSPALALEVCRNVGRAQQGGEHSQLLARVLLAFMAFGAPFLFILPESPFLSNHRERDSVDICTDPFASVAALLQALHCFQKYSIKVASEDLCGVFTCVFFCYSSVSREECFSIFYAIIFEKKGKEENVL